MSDIAIENIKMASKPTVRVPAEVAEGCHCFNCDSPDTPPLYWTLDESSADNSYQNELNGTTIAESLAFMTNCEVITDMDATDFGWWPICETCFRYWYLNKEDEDGEGYKHSDINVKWWVYKYVVQEATG